MIKSIKSLSIVMPTYNCAQYLENSVKSILNQSFTDFEFLIIDDGSTDSTEELISKIKDSRIKYIKLDHVGFTSALNLGLSLAQSEWVARMDSDDIAHPDRLRFQTDKLNSDKRINIISCSYFVFKNQRISYFIRLPEYNHQIKKALLKHSVICHPGVIYEKSLITQYGGYKERLLGDYELWLRLYDKACFYNLQLPLMYIRDRKSSISRHDLNNTKKIVFDIQAKAFQDHFFRINNDILAWNELNFGSKLNARKYWKNEGFKLFIKPKSMIAFLFCFLPDCILRFFQFIKLKQKLELLLFRIRYKNYFEYFYSYFITGIND